MTQTVLHVDLGLMAWALGGTVYALDVEVDYIYKSISNNRDLKKESLFYFKKLIKPLEQW